MNSSTSMFPLPACLRTRWRSFSVLSRYRRRRGPRLRRAGASVVLASRDEAALEAVAETIRFERGKALVVSTDVLDDRQLERAVEKAVDTFGGLDIVQQRRVGAHAGAPGGPHDETDFGGSPGSCRKPGGAL